MKEEFEFNQSTDLLNDFLGQSSDDDKDPIITDDDKVEMIEPVNKKVENNTDLDVINELPEDLLNDITEQQEEELNDNKESKDTDSQYSFIALTSLLSEEGIIDFENAEGLEDTPEVLFNSISNTIAKEIENYKESIPEKAKQILEFLEKGGSIDDYISKLQKPVSFNSIDLTLESDQETIVRENLKLQGYEPSEIDETISDYKDSLILDKQAKLAEKQVKKYYDRQEQQLLEQQEALQAAQQEEYRNHITILNNTIDTSETLAGLPIDNKVKADFKKYLLQVDKDGLTPYAREVKEDPIKTQLELAYLKYMKYDFSKALKKGETNATKKFKEIFKSTEKNVAGKSVNETNKFGDLSAFSSFKNK